MAAPDRASGCATRTGESWWRGRQREASFDVFVQEAHPGATALSGDRATGRDYLSEVIRIRGGASHLNHAIYHDHYQRTRDGWRFAERT